MIALTIEQMKVLQEKGLDCSNASTYWYGSKNWKNDHWYVNSYTLMVSTKPINFTIETIPAFTLEDILSILPVISIKGYFDGEKYISNYAPELHINGKFSTIRYDFEDSNISFQGEPLEIAYQLLIWCLDNKYIK